MMSDVVPMEGWDMKYTELCIRIKVWPILIWHAYFICSTCIQLSKADNQGVNI